MHGCKPDEIPGSGAEFRNLAGLDLQLLPDDVPHEVNDIFWRVITVENGVLRRLIFLVGKQFLECLMMAIAFHENFGQSAPSAELRKRDLLLVRRLPSFSFEFLQQTDRLEIRLNPRRRSRRHPMPAVILKVPRNDRFRNVPHLRLNRRLHRGKIEQIQLYCFHHPYPFG